MCGAYFPAEHLTNDEIGHAVSEFRRKLREAGHVTYGISALEICPQTGRAHVQFYVCFSCVKRLLWLKNQIGEGCSFIACKGDPDQNIAYVKKTREEDNSPNSDVEEFGRKPRSLAERVAGMDQALGDLIERIMEGDSDDILKELAVHTLLQFLFIDELFDFDIAEEHINMCNEYEANNCSESDSDVEMID